jgi:hypothetical protein
MSMVAWIEGILEVKGEATEASPNLTIGTSESISSRYFSKAIFLGWGERGREEVEGRGEKGGTVRRRGREEEGGGGGEGIDVGEEDGW